MELEWLDGMDAAVTVCDRDGVILYLNARAAESFKDQGGVELVGKSLFDCHLEESNRKIRQMLADGSTNAYTVEKNGKKKFVRQAPWRKDGVCRGLVEIVAPVPFEIPNIVRNHPPT
jgi:transcriptional regulator with PAS, ATPase and Fis domain